MKLHTLTYNGVSSSTVGLYVLNSTTLNSPEREIETAPIAGSSGDFIYDTGRYKNLTVEYEVCLRPVANKTLIEQIQDVKNYLYYPGAPLGDSMNTAFQYRYYKLQDDYRPNVWRYGCFFGPLDWELKMLKYARAVLYFNCQPQVHSDEQTLTLTDSQLVTLPNAADYLPANGRYTLHISKVVIKSNTTSSVHGSYKFYGQGFASPFAVEWDTTNKWNTTSYQVTLYPDYREIYVGPNESLNRYLTESVGNWGAESRRGSVTTMQLGAVRGLKYVSGGSYVTGVTAVVTYDRWTV